MTLQSKDKGENGSIESNSRAMISWLFVNKPDKAKK